MHYTIPQTAFVEMLTKVITFGNDVNVRGSDVRELLNQQVTIKVPTYNCLFVPHRNDNIFAKIAETLWVLAGRDDIPWLSKYLPRAADYSDNGITWRAAYGPRIRNWNGADKRVDQLFEVVRVLLDDPMSRRAVISIWDPSEDTCYSKDIPCNNWLNFYIRDNMLHLNVAQRSSDVLWGFSGINMFEWSILMSIVAQSCNVAVGSLTFFFTNIHLYKQHYNRAKQIIEAYEPSQHDFYERFGLHNVPMSDSTHTLDSALEHVFIAEANYSVGDYSRIADPTGFFGFAQNMLRIYNGFLNIEKLSIPVFASMFQNLPLNCDFRYAAIDFMYKKLGDTFLENLSIDDSEMEIIEAIRMLNHAQPLLQH